MGSLNKVCLIGRLEKDPESSYTQGGTARSVFSLATDEYRTNSAGEREQLVQWHSIVAWAAQAEFCNRYLRKGRLVYVEGKLQTSSWETPEGQKRYRTQVVAGRVQALDAPAQTCSEMSVEDRILDQRTEDRITADAFPQTSSLMDEPPF